MMMTIATQVGIIILFAQKHFYICSLKIINRHIIAREDGREGGDVDVSRNITPGE